MNPLKQRPVSQFDTKHATLFNSVGQAKQRPRGRSTEHKQTKERDVSPSVASIESMEKAHARHPAMRMRACFGGRTRRQRGPFDLARF